MKNSPNRYGDEGRVLANQKKPETFSSQSPGSDIDSASELGVHTTGDVRANFNNFFMQNTPQPKFLSNLSVRHGSNAGSSDLDSADLSDSFEESSREKGSWPKERTFPLSLHNDLLSQSGKLQTLTFHELNSPGSRSLVGTEMSRQNSAFPLKKMNSGIDSNVFSAHQLLDAPDELKMSQSEKHNSGASSPFAINIKPLKDFAEAKERAEGVLSADSAAKQRATSSIGTKTARSSNAIIARALMRAAFKKAIQSNRIFDPTPKELDLLKDKSWVPKVEEDEPSKKVDKPKDKGPPKLKMILENHGIISEKIKPYEIEGILKNIRKSRTLKEACSRTYKIVRNTVKNKLVFIKKATKVFHFTFYPTSQFRMGWDVISLLLIFYDIVMIPLEMGFNIDVTGFLLYFEEFEDFFFCADVLINFRTAFYRDGVLIKKSLEIAKKYARSWLAIDVIACLTSSPILDWILPANVNSHSFRLLRFLRFVRFMRVLRALRLKKIFNRMEQYLYSNVYISIMGMVSLLFYIAFLAHLSACLWHFVGYNFTDVESNTWLEQGNFIDLGTGDRYVICLFWAITTMLTVGYGDIVPVNTLERIVNILIMLLGCGIFAYSMNKIGQLLHRFNQDSTQTRQLYYNITKYLEKMEVTPSLKSKVVQYLDYMNENQKYGKMAEDHVFSYLSESLREEVRKDINGKVLRENSILLKNFDTRFLSLVSYKLEERTYSPGQIIFDEFDKASSLYLISKGIVEIHVPRCDTVICRLEKEGHFGEYSFFTGKPRAAAARSIVFAHIFSITQKDFLDLVEEYPREKEMYHLIKDKINLYHDASMLENKCSVCGMINHDARECYRIHYVPNRQQHIKDYLNGIEKFRERFKRRKRTKFKALFNIDEVAYQASVIVDNYPEETKKLFADISPRRQRNLTVRDEFEDFAKRTRKKTTIKSAANNANNQTIVEENSHAESSGGTGNSNKGRTGKPSQFKPKTTGSKSFDTDDDDESLEEMEKPVARRFIPERPSLIQQAAVPNFEKVLFKASSKTRQGGRLDSITPRSLLDDPFMKAMEEGYLMQQMPVFDMVCSYTVYFPHNNIHQILGLHDPRLKAAEGNRKARKSIGPGRKQAVTHMEIAPKKQSSFSSVFKGTELKKKIQSVINFNKKKPGESPERKKKDLLGMPERRRQSVGAKRPSVPKSMGDTS